MKESESKKQKTGKGLYETKGEMMEGGIAGESGRGWNGVGEGASMSWY